MADTTGTASGSAGATQTLPDRVDEASMALLGRVRARLAAAQTLMAETQQMIAEAHRIRPGDAIGADGTIKRAAPRQPGPV